MRTRSGHPRAPGGRPGLEESRLEKGLSSASPTRPHTQEGAGALRTQGQSGHCQHAVGMVGFSVITEALEGAWGLRFRGVSQLRGRHAAEYHMLLNPEGTWACPAPDGWDSSPWKRRLRSREPSMPAQMPPSSL